MAEKTGNLSLRERQQKRTRRDLTEAAIRVISSEGWDKSTLDMIALEAGSSRGTLYSYFPGGRDEVIREAYTLVSRDLVTSAEKAASRHTDWRRRILCYAEAMLTVSEDPHVGRFYNIYGPQLITGGETGQGSQAFNAAFIRELEQAKQMSERFADVDVTSAALLLVGALREAGIDATNHPGNAQRHLRTFEQILEGVARGVAAHSTAVSASDLGEGHL
jgi:AcrR family transcriptional regulator